MDLTEIKISSEEIFDGKILKVHRDQVKLPNGKTSSREVVDHPGAVSIVALDDDKNIYLVRQFRYPVNKVLLEVPAGKLDGGEDPLDCAKRELAEEVGVAASEWQKILTFYTTPGFSNEIMHAFLAKGLTPHIEDKDEDEFLEVIKIPLKDAVNKILKGEIQDAKTISSILAVAYTLDT
ncbi:MAG: ADP-ribose pyrophosphatase [Clostridia bacterium]|nr:ADP-ribose pyrophosphatase [Clostridia bacterium]